MRALRAAAVLILAATFSLAHAEIEYYKLTPNIAASAATRGDELFGEMVTNLPPSNVVNGPQSVALRIYGSCSSRQYVKQGLMLFTGKWRSGHAMGGLDSDNITRKVMPGTPIATLFDRECGT